jgi:hypothetical protein
MHLDVTTSPAQDNGLRPVIATWSCAPAAVGSAREAASPSTMKLAYVGEQGKQLSIQNGQLNYSSTIDGVNRTQICHGCSRVVSTKAAFLTRDQNQHVFL